MEEALNTIVENICDLSPEHLEQLVDAVSGEQSRRSAKRSAARQAQDAAERYAEAVKDDPAHEWSPGAVVGPGGRVLEGDTEFVNTSGAWLSVPPSEYPLGYERVEAPADVLEFRAGEQVETGDLREYQGVIYQVLQSHVTADHWAPDVAVSLWTKA